MLFIPLGKKLTHKHNKLNFRLENCTWQSKVIQINTIFLNFLYNFKGYTPFTVIIKQINTIF